MKSLFKKIILKLITLEAKLVLMRHKPLVIGVTGNLGKTTTKDSIVAVLRDKNIRYTKKSMNSDFGAPLTILGQSSGWSSLGKWTMIILRGAGQIFSKNYPKILILEIGADHKGDIESLAKWIKVDIGVMTQFADVPVHIENFKSREELIAEKEYMVKSIKKSGTFIYNSDCADSASMAERLKDNSKNIELISFGKKSGDVRAHIIIDDAKNKKVKSQVIYKNKNYNIECDGVLGEAAILAALPAFAIGKKLDIDEKVIFANIKSSERTPGRMRVLDGKNSTVIIDDSYNSSPLAVMNGLKTVGDTNVIGRKIVMLADMLELGEHTKEEHLKIGKEAARVAHILVTVGNRARFIAEGALNNGMNEGWILECDDSESAGREVLGILKAGDLVYVKGSQSMRMEKATKILLEEHVNIKTELARQEDEWINKK